jgi:hypothetical protein
MANVQSGVRADSRAKLRDSTTVFLVGNIEPTMEWYKSLGFEAEFYPPGFAILRRDEIEIFLQQQPGYVAPDDLGARAPRLERVHHHGRRESPIRGILFVAGSKNIASALPAGLRDAGVRRNRSQRTSASIRTADAGKLIHVAAERSDHTNIGDRIRNARRLA